MTAKTPTPTEHTAPAARAIARLNAQLLSLAEGEDPPDPATIERTARAITSLIRSVEQAQDFLGAHDAERPGFRLSEAARTDLLRRIRIAAGRGLIPGVAAVERPQ